MSQILRPYSTISTTSGIGVKNGTAGSCHLVMDEETPNTTDYIYAPTGTGGETYTAVFGLESFKKPAIKEGLFSAYLFQDHAVYVNASSYAKLMLGSTTLITLTSGGYNSWSLESAIISEENMALIAAADPSDLTVQGIVYRHKFYSENQGTYYAYSKASWIEVQLPDPISTGLEMGCNF